MIAVLLTHSANALNRVVSSLNGSVALPNGNWRQ